MAKFLSLLIILFIAVALTTAMPFKRKGLKKKFKDIIKMVKTPYDSMNYLENFGYLTRKQRQSMDIARSRTKNKYYSRAIRKFQKMAKLTETGLLDNATMEMMNQPRCGCTDSVGDEGGRKRRYVEQGTSWSTNDIKYFIRNYSPDLTKREIDDTIRTAFSFWSDVTPLTFTQVHSLPAEIEIRFADGDHGDGTPFDFQGPVLAHAFPPHDNKPGLPGDMHFDEAHVWTINSEEGHNLLYVAVHELGHSLGLLHSNVQDSIMWPWARQGYDPNLKLSEDDIKGIQAIYGKPTVTTTSTPKTTTTTTPTTTTTVSTTTTPKENICSGKIDAITVAVDGATYIFKNEQVYKLSSAGVSVERGFPLLTYFVFPGAPSKVDAALTYFNNRVTYLFRGNLYYRYSLQDGRIVADAGYPKYIKDGWGLDISYIDAIFAWSDKIFFVKGTQYYGHDGYSPLDAYPRSLHHHKALRVLLERGVTNVNAAVQWINKKNYFFSDGQYYRWTHGSGDGYMTGPLSTAWNWLGCSNGSLQ